MLLTQVNACSGSMWQAAISREDLNNLSFQMLRSRGIQCFQCWELQDTSQRAPGSRQNDIKRNVQPFPNLYQIRPEFLQQFTRNYSASADVQ